MGITKTNLFTKKQNDLARLAKAIAHPARIAILDHLIASNSCINSDLVEETGLAQATVSQHLRELKEAGFIKGNIEGSSMCYCIDAVQWSRVEQTFTLFFNRYKASEDVRCC
jgi:DNA-binding transcriptional ArsR family regulator